MSESGIEEKREFQWNGEIETIDGNIVNGGLIEHLESKNKQLSEELEAVKAEVEEWRDAANNASGCDTPDGLKGFIFSAYSC